MGRAPRSDEDFAREIDAHVALETDRLIAEGMPPGEARAAALRAFGSPTRAREQFYESRRRIWLDHAKQDARYALRTLGRHRSFSLTVVLTLALGLGANLAIFSVINGVLLQPAPFRDADRLVMVWQTDRASGTTREPGSIPDFADVRRSTSTLEGLSAFQGADVNVTPDTGDDPFRVAALAATHDFLPLAGITPGVGRGFTAEEDAPGAPRVAIISEALWERQFGRDPEVTRRSIRLNEVPHAIVGVMPRTADFGVLQILSAAAYGRSFADRGRVRVDVWLPLRADPGSASRDNHLIFMLGRLTPGISLETARDEMTRIAANLERDYPTSNEARGMFVEPLDAVVLGPIRPAFYLLLAGVGLLLAVAYANVLNLLFVHFAARAREVAVRSALGAGIARLVRQFMVEGLVLSTLALAVAVPFAYWALEVLVGLAPAGIPRIDEVTLDRTSLAAASAATVFMAVGAGLVPLMQTRRIELQNTLKNEAGRTASSGRSENRMRSALVVVQIGLAVMLLIGAGLLINSFWKIRNADPGFRAQGVLKAEYELPSSRYPQLRREFPNWTAVKRFHDELLRRARGLPNVEAAAVAAFHPLAAGFTSSFAVVGREAESRDWPEISQRTVSADYARVTGLPLLSGRHLRDADDARAPRAVMINDAARRQFFSSQDPVGQRLAFWGLQWAIVGIVGDEKIHGLSAASPPAVYLSFNQVPTANALLLRVKGDPTSVAGDVRAIFREVDPALAVFGIEPLERTMSESLAERRFIMVLLGSFAAVTLALALVGVYGALSYSVARRRREIGVRLAFGAAPSRVLGRVLREGAALAGAGLAAGTAAAWMLTRLIANLLYAVTPTDPLTFVAAPLLLIVAAVAAAWVPARRASRVDPLIALRD
jgi:putative ABC transport system permease protein